jgi:hypothetical protein
MNNTLNGMDAVQPILLCQNCKVEMRLVGVEPEKHGRDLFTFECPKCSHLETRAVKTLKSSS